MTPYYIVFLLLLWFSWNYDFSNKIRTKEKYEKLVLLILVLMAGFRYHIGGDTINYIHTFEHTEKIPELIRSGLGQDQLLQPIWTLFLSAVRTFTDDYLYVQIIHAVFFNLLLYRFIKKSDGKVFLSFAIMFWIIWVYLNFENARESLCVALFLNGYIELKDGNLGRYLLYVLPALFIHYFAIIIIAIVLLLYYLTPKQTIITFTILSFFMMFIDADSLSSYLILAMGYTDGSLVDLASRYLDSDMYGFSNLNLFGIMIKGIHLLWPISLALYLYKKGENILDVKVSILFVFLLVAAARIVIFARFENYIWPIIIVETSIMLSTEKLRNSRSVIISTLVIFNVITYHGYFKKPNADSVSLGYDYRYIPYKTVFQSPDPTRESYYSTYFLYK